MPKQLAAEKTRQRRPQERAQITRQKLLDVAIREFSERGYDAVTVREIETLAGVQRNLLSYHFGSKEGMWKAAASHTLTQLQEFGEAREEVVRDLSARERVAYVLRSFVRFSASHPEFHRLMIQEGKHDSWRIEWLVDEFLGPAMNGLRERLAIDLELSDRDEFVHWYYMFTGGGALMFSMAPEAKRLFGVDVDDEAIIERHASIMVDFLLTRADGGRELTGP